MENDVNQNNAVISVGFCSEKRSQFRVLVIFIEKSFYFRHRFLKKR